MSKNFNVDWGKVNAELKYKQNILSLQNHVNDFLKEMNNDIDNLILHSIHNGFNFIVITKPELLKLSCSYNFEIRYIPIIYEETANYYQSQGCEILDLNIIKQAFNLGGYK